MKTSTVLELLNDRRTLNAPRFNSTGSPLFRFLLKCEESPSLAAQVRQMSRHHIVNALQLGGFSKSFVPVAWGRLEEKPGKDAPLSLGLVEGIGVDPRNGEPARFVIEKNGIAERYPDRNIGGVAGWMAEIITDADPGSLEIDQKGLAAFLSAIRNRLEMAAEAIGSE